MKLIETLLTALSALSAHKLRSFLTMLGIIIGVSSVVIMMGLGAGAQQEVEKKIDAMGTNMLMIRSMARQSGGVSQGSSGTSRLLESDAEAIADEISGVRYVAPVVSGRAQVVNGNENWSTRVQGVTTDFLTVHNWQLSNNQNRDSVVFRSNGKDVLLGATVAEELFGVENPVGRQIRINKVPFTIQGVLLAKGEGATGMDQDDMVLVPLVTARKRLFGVRKAAPTAVDVITVQVSELDEMDRVSNDIVHLLKDRHRLAPSDMEPFRITNMTERMFMRAATSQVFNSLLAGVACVSLLVGGIGIMNIMLVSVTERTREIGVRLALGGRQSDILMQFLVEAIVLCGLGGLAGIGVAIAGLFAAEYFTGLPAVIEPMVSVASVLFSALIGLFFGYYPAHKASRLNPVEALRYD